MSHIWFIYKLKPLYIMEPTKKPKLKYFNVVKSEAVKQINEFLSQNDSIDVKSISMDDTGVNAVVWRISCIEDKLNKNANVEQSKEIVLVQKNDKVYYKKVKLVKIQIFFFHFISFF